MIMVVMSLLVSPPSSLPPSLPPYLCMSSSVRGQKLKPKQRTTNEGERAGVVASAA